jgi:LysM repeat protein
VNLRPETERKDSFAMFGTRSAIVHQRLAHEIPSAIGRRLLALTSLSAISYQLSALVFVAFVGCATQKPAQPPPSLPALAYSASSTSKVDAILRNAKQEVTALRADLGAARIAATKKDIETEELRRDLAQYRQRFSDLQVTKEQHQYVGEKAQQELATVKAERERLMRDRQELQRQLDELPKLREALAASRAGETQVQAKVKELETALAALAEQLTKTREPRSTEPSSDQPRETDTAPPEATSSVTGERSSAAVSLVEQPQKGDTVFMVTLPSLEADWIPVTVKVGDTLWDLARAHGVSVERLKSMNKLSGDVIRPGRTLLVPAKP